MKYLIISQFQRRAFIAIYIFWALLLAALIYSCASKNDKTSKSDQIEIIEQYIDTISLKLNREVVPAMILLDEMHQDIKEAILLTELWVRNESRADTQDKNRLRHLVFDSIPAKSDAFNQMDFNGVINTNASVKDSLIKSVQTTLETIKEVMELLPDMASYSDLVNYLMADELIAPGERLQNNYKNLVLKLDELKLSLIMTQKDLELKKLKFENEIMKLRKRM